MCGVGFVADLKGRRSHGIVEQALTVVKNLLHRGACGSETAFSSAQARSSSSGIWIRQPAPSPTSGSAPRAPR